MHPFVAKHLVYHPIQYIRKQYVKEYLRPVMQIQYGSCEEIQRMQDAKLIDTVKYAYYNIDFYKKRFDQVNIHPEKIENLQNLFNLPVLKKIEVLENEKRLIAENFNGPMHVRKTGGSTGMTLHFMKEPKALALNDAVMYRCYDWYGIDIGDKQARFWGVPVTGDLRRKEQLKDFILNRIRISAFDISEKACLKQYEKIRRFKPTYFYGYTTAIYGFCRVLRNAGIDLNELNLKAVICTAEKMYPHHRELFDQVFKCPVVDEYGSAENGIIAFQCRHGNMHLMADHLCVEFLDENDRPVPPGTPGRIVTTDLSTRAMPLIRYDTGDIGKPSDRQCGCGINLPLMEIVEGRKEDFIRTIDGKLVHAAYLCYTLKDDTVHEFKMFQKATDLLHVHIVKSERFNSESEVMLENKLRTALGDKVIIEFFYCDRIPREKSGKLRYFVSELSQPIKN